MNTQALNRKYEAIAWGVFFIGWGITILLGNSPEGMGLIGIGVILLGLNLARYLSHIRASGFTIFLGTLALVLGVLDVMRAVLHLETELPVFPVLLIVIGSVWLLRALLTTSEKHV